MSSDVLPQLLAGNQVGTFGRGRIFNLLSATFPVSIVAEYRGIGPGQTKHKVFNNIPAGSKFTADPADGEWTYLRVTNGPNAQNITIFVGSDDMSFNNAVTITGVAVTNIQPNGVLAQPNPPLDGNIANAAATSVLQNLARRAITVSSPPTNTGTVYIQNTGAGAGPHGIPLQPGTFETLTNTGAFDVRNDSGAAQYITFVEET